MITLFILFFFFFFLNPFNYFKEKTIPSVLRELAGVLDVLRRNDWVSAVPDNPEVTVWSDASDLEWAAVLEIVPEEVIQGCFPSLHIIFYFFCLSLNSVHFFETKIHLNIIPWSASVIVARPFGPVKIKKPFRLTLYFVERRQNPVARGK